MLDGIKSGFAEVEFKIRVSIPAPSGSGIQYGGRGGITSYYTPDVLTVNVGIQVAVTNSTGGPPFLPGMSASLDIPDLSISRSYTSASIGAVEVYNTIFTNFIKIALQPIACRFILVIYTCSNLPFKNKEHFL